jgi:hypothetical protein
VDGATFQWLGETGNATKLINTLITATRSIFTVQAGVMLLNITFLSPIEVRPDFFPVSMMDGSLVQKPSDWVRQSIPFSYVYVDMASVDGQPHSVQIYSDISAREPDLFIISLPDLSPNDVLVEWASGDRGSEAQVQWNTTEYGGFVYHQAQRIEMAYMQETNDIADYGTVYYGMSEVRKNKVCFIWLRK